MHSNDAQWARLIDDAAQELYKVYWTEITPGLMQNWDRWDLVQENQKAAWRKVAEHVVQQNTELFGLLTAPDHR